MKTAVIVGVLHMTLGLMQKGFNTIYRKDNIEFYHVFLPQMIFMLCLVGYMDIMIIIKWCTNYYGYEHNAPSIIQALVGMFLDNGRVEG